MPNVLNLEDIIVKDQLAQTIANQYTTWQTLRQNKVSAWEEIQRYIFATDTKDTSNASLPWKNTTTIPKLCQIRDNLAANYMASLFPKRKWVVWEGSTERDQDMEKTKTIQNYMSWVLDQKEVKNEFKKLILDYIDYGNAICMADWLSFNQNDPNKNKSGYVGPTPRRISPLDIVFDPIATDFQSTTKIVKSLLTMGELKKIVESYSNVAEYDQYKEIFEYCKGLRNHANQIGSEFQVKDAIFEISGFTSYQAYLQSNYVEVLTAYGDFYDVEEDKFYENSVITVLDRHRILDIKPNPSYFGYTPIFHAGWRIRQDNLWAMGPLENLVGMQYRVDHIENLKADVFDLIAYPLTKVKGFVEDFEWQPMEKIYVGDDGDVEMIAPPFQVLQANVEIKNLTDTMEVMAGAPKEAMGFRTPGEKTMYEVQRLENAAARIFMNKILQFETEIVEPLLNAMLEMARRNMGSSVVRIFDDENMIVTFQELTADDITGSGRIRPVAAKHFAEQAEQIQNLTNFSNSPIFADPDVKMHISGINLAKYAIEDLLDLDKYKIFTPYIRLSEQADAQRQINSHQQQVMGEAQTPSGVLSQADTAQPFAGQVAQ